MTSSSAPGQLPPLPGLPAFPVYGLAEAADEPRWLELWNAPRQLYSVDIGHGNPDFSSGPAAVVVTYATPPPESTAGVERNAPFGVEDAVLGALLYLWHASQSPDPTQPATRTASRDLLELSRDLNSPAWAAIDVRVDGQLRAARALSRDALWVVGLDLGPLAIGVFGSHRPLDHLALEPVDDAVLGMRRPPLPPQGRVGDGVERRA